jgi:BirA family transcriptional regulator, biotin operon repressor / biotin---[acetyl-CoA-carboxylase] ligase
VGASTQIWPDQWPPGWHVEHVSETGSTNADLLARVATGAPDRSVLAADHQTRGRGRLDRRWDAPPGANLLVSILFRQVPDAPGELTRRVGLAAADAARELSGLDVGLKWPNDLVVGDAKLAGILAQRASTGEVVVGLGLNVRWAPDGAARLGDHVAPPSVLAEVLEAYDRLPADITGRYRDRLHTLGRRVRVELPDGEIVGRATDVDPDGRLVVLDECGVTHRLDVGDVVHVRGAEPAG